MEKGAEKIETHERKTGEKVIFSPECKDDTSIADYVWLPLRFAGSDKEHPNGMVYIDWRDEWSLDEFE